MHAKFITPENDKPLCKITKASRASCELVVTEFWLRAQQNSGQVLITVNDVSP
jgi:hypothetical protein